MKKIFFILILALVIVVFKNQNYYHSKDVLDTPVSIDARAGIITAAMWLKDSVDVDTLLSKFDHENGMLKPTD